MYVSEKERQEWDVDVRVFCYTFMYPNVRLIAHTCFWMHDL